jgi:hypothetical protein
MKNIFLIGMGLVFGLGVSLLIGHKDKIKELANPSKCKRRSKTKTRGGPIV